MRFKLIENLQLNEGCWSLPFTTDKVNKLEIILSNPINNEDAPDVLYDIYGEDKLFDSFYNPENPDDVRPEIKEAIRDLLDSYSEHPNNFRDNCSQYIFDKLNKLVKEN